VGEHAVDQPGASSDPSGVAPTHRWGTLLQRSMNERITQSTAKTCPLFVGNSKPSSGTGMCSNQVGNPLAEDVPRATGVGAEEFAEAKKCSAPLGLETKTALESWSVLMVT